MGGATVSGKLKSQVYINQQLVLKISKTWLNPNRWRPCSADGAETEKYM